MSNYAIESKNIHYIEIDKKLKQQIEFNSEEEGVRIIKNCDNQDICIFEKNNYLFDVIEGFCLKEDYKKVTENHYNMLKNKYMAYIDSIRTYSGIMPLKAKRDVKLINIYNITSKESILKFIKKKITKKEYMLFEREYDINKYLPLFHLYIMENKIDGIYIKNNVLIRGNILKKLFEIDETHNLHWKNTDFDILKKYNIYEKGFVIIKSEANKNKDFALVKFYFDNDEKNIFDYNAMQTKIYIMSYNVHLFRNLNFMINTRDNLFKIFDLVLTFNPPVITLQEMVEINKQEYINKFFDELGYKYQVMTINGNLKNINDPMKQLYLGVLSKMPIEEAVNINITLFKYERNAII